MSSHRASIIAIEANRALSLKRQPTTLRRCLKCEWWMHSTGPDHRICNRCKGFVGYRGRDGTRVKER
jgi:tRNA(Ile2) C34 agmatinyltransferase TiaS